MSGSEDKPVVNIPSLEELEKMVMKSLQEEGASISSSETECGSWEDFIEN